MRRDNFWRWYGSMLRARILFLMVFLQLSALLAVQGYGLLALRADWTASPPAGIEAACCSAGGACCCGQTGECHCGCEEVSFGKPGAASAPGLYFCAAGCGDPPANTSPDLKLPEFLGQSCGELTHISSKREHFPAVAPDLSRPGAEPEKPPPKVAKTA